MASAGINTSAEDVAADAARWAVHLTKSWLPPFSFANLVKVLLTTIVIFVVWKLVWKGWQSYIDANLQKLVTACTNKIEKALNKQKLPAVGLAIVIRTVVSPPLGTDKDVENMKSALESLKFAVMKKDITRLDDLRAIVKAAAEYPYTLEAPLCKVIVLYYAGHGNSKGGRPLVVIRDGEEYFVEDIVSLFYPMNAPHLENIKRLFFFDMCLGEKVNAGIRKLVKAKPLIPILKHAVPAKGNCLVAFANSVGFESRGTEDGGFWTRHLYKNITENMEIHEVLAQTHDDTANDPELQQRVKDKNIQGPFWTTCMGRLNLQRLSDNGEQERFPNHPSRSVPKPAAGRGQPKDRVVATDSVDIDHLMNKEPELTDLLNWLDDIKSSCFQLGEQLKVRVGTLKAIEQSYPGRFDRQLSEVFTKWENGRTSPHTFKNLLDCLKKMEEGMKYVDVIEKKLRDTEVYDKYSSREDYCE